MKYRQCFFNDNESRACNAVYYSPDLERNKLHNQINMLGDHIVARTFLEMRCLLKQAPIYNPREKPNVRPHDIETYFRLVILKAFEIMTAGERITRFIFTQNRKQPHPTVGVLIQGSTRSTGRALMLSTEAIVNPTRQIFGNDYFYWEGSYQMRAFMTGDKKNCLIQVDMDCEAFAECEIQPEQKAPTKPTKVFRLNRVHAQTVAI